MPSVYDVAAYILDQAGPMTAMKLQKLVYYSQAWHLVWDDEILFPESIQVWANGPVVPDLYDKHRGQYTVEAPWRWGRVDALTDAQRTSIDGVLNAYGDFTAQQLSVLSHSERPWREARHELQPLERGSEIVEPMAMADYYGSLLQDGSPSEPVRGSTVPED